MQRVRDMLPLAALVHTYLIDRAASDLRIRGTCGRRPRHVLRLAQNQSDELGAGVSMPFAGLGGFAHDYREATARAAPHLRARPFVFGPGEVSRFDELTVPARPHSEVIERDPRCLPDLFELVYRLAPPAL